MFPGQFHWHALDQIEGPSFTFSVLRQPVARIVSFYFFLRAVAARSDPAKLSGPHMQGIHAALTLPPDAFFCDSGSPEVRTHIDDLFDNFYTFYFAGRAFNARRRIQKKTFPKPKSWPPRNATSICSTASIRPTIWFLPKEDIIASFGRSGIGLWGTLHSRFSPLPGINLNTREEDFISRATDLKVLGATHRTFERINDMARLDSMIWTARFGHIPVLRLD